MKFFTSDNLKEIGKAGSAILDCMTRKDVSHKEENQLWQETLLKKCPNLYGPILNAVNENRESPQKEELLRKQTMEIEELKIKYAKIIEENRNNNTLSNKEQTIQEAQSNIHALNSLQNSLTPYTKNDLQDLSNVDQFSNNSNTQQTSNKTFFDEMDNMYKGN